MAATRYMMGGSALPGGSMIVWCVVIVGGAEVVSFSVSLRKRTLSSCKN